MMTRLKHEKRNKQFKSFNHEPVSGYVNNKPRVKCVDLYGPNNSIKKANELRVGGNRADKVLRKF